MLPFLHIPPQPQMLFHVPDWSPRVIIFNNYQATHRATDNLKAFLWTGKKWTGLMFPHK